MGAVYGGSTEEIYSDLGLTGRVVWHVKKLEAAPFFSFCPKMFPIAGTIIKEDKKITGVYGGPWKCNASLG